MEVKSNELAVQGQGPKSLLISRAEEQMEIAKRIIVNGKKLADDEIRALAVYMAQTGLSVSDNECYYMPGTGPVIGIAGVRRKAREAAMEEARAAKYRLVGKGYRLEFISGEDAKLPGIYDISQGDIAYECILTSDMDEAFWLQKLMPIITQLKSMGLSYEDARNEAIRFIGDCPRTRYVGVVFGKESFSFGDKPEKMDRHERAKKRAEKGALKRRFSIPLDTDIEFAEDAIDMRIIDPGPQPDNKFLNGKTNDELISSLGFEDEPDTSKAAVKHSAPKKKEPEVKLPKANSKNYEIAASFKSKFVNKLYGDMNVSELQAEIMTLTQTEPKDREDGVQINDRIQAAKELIKYLDEHPEG